VLVAYAARDGTTAADGSGRNSPFTASLLKNLERPGLEVRFLLAAVRDDVMAATKREQQPFVYGSLSQDMIYLGAPADAGTNSPPRPPHPAVASVNPQSDVFEKPAPEIVVEGLHLARLNEEMRTRYKIRDTAKGAVITAVDAGSDAAERGIRPGDVIVGVGEQTVSDADDVKMVIDLIRKSGKKGALLKFATASSARFVPLPLAADAGTPLPLISSAQPPTTNEYQTLKAIGLDLAFLNEDMRSRYHIRSITKGVVVTGVDAGSYAEQVGIRPGYVIIKVAEQAVTNADDVKRVVNQLRKAGNKAGGFLMKEGSLLRFATLPLPADTGALQPPKSSP
jgi:membrane-associated protease RseP (regulator of RpoE activity)